MRKKSDKFSLRHVGHKVEVAPARDPSRHIIVICCNLIFTLTETREKIAKMFKVSSQLVHFSPVSDILIFLTRENELRVFCSHFYMEHRALSFVSRSKSKLYQICLYKLIIRCVFSLLNFPPLEHDKLVVLCVVKHETNLMIFQWQEQTHIFLTQAA